MSETACQTDVHQSSDRRVHHDSNLIQAGKYMEIRKGRKDTKDSGTIILGDMGRGQGVYEATEEGSFCSTGDKRIKKCVLRHRVEEMMNVYLSFDPIYMRFSNCPARPKHSVWGGREGWSHSFHWDGPKFPPDAVKH